MKHSLLLLGVIAALAIGTPAYSQYIFMDAGTDTICNDVLTTSSTGVDIWLNTNHNKDGTAAVCSTNPAKTFNISSYALLIHYGGSGSVAYNSYTNAVSQFSLNLDPMRTAGPDMSVSYAEPSPGVVLPPGKYKLGRVNITVTGSPQMSFLVVPSDPNFVPVTGFGSECPSPSWGNTIALGYDFFDNCGTGGGTPTKSTTWGQIKLLYK